MEKPRKFKKIKKYIYHDKRLLRFSQAKVVMKIYNPILRKNKLTEVWVPKDRVNWFEKPRKQNWITSKIRTGKKDRHRTKAEKC